MAARRPEKWALLIGINTYPHFGPQYQLHGCVNDVDLMQEILTARFAFDPARITRLTNEAATRRAVLTALLELAHSIGPDDTILLHFSGHGSQRTDGPEQDEPDGLDETLVMADSGRDPVPNRDISDDEIYAWLLQVASVGANVTLILDCCHSGAFTRSAFGAPARQVKADDRPAAMFPEPALPLFVNKDPASVAHGGGWLPLGNRNVIFSGCAHDERAFELVQDGVRHGALTYFLAQALLHARPESSYRDLFERILPQVEARYPRQHPQLEGARDRIIFSDRAPAPTPFIAVGRRQNATLTLQAGAAHGMTVGSRFSVFSPGVRQISPAVPRLGLVEIKSVQAIASEAAILEEAADRPLHSGCRAVEDAHSFGAMQWTVSVNAPEDCAQSTAKLKEAIEESPLLRLLESGEEADAGVYLLLPHPAEADRPIPQLPHPSMPAWAAVGHDGRLLMPVRPVSAAAPFAIRDNLEKSVRYAQTLSLSNPNEGALRREGIDFTLLRQDSSGAWRDAGTAEGERDAGGLPLFYAGERIAFSVTNHHEWPVYVCMLDFGLTGAITQLHPDHGVSEPLLPGRTLCRGILPGDESFLFLPDDFPFAPDPEDGLPTGGVETYKLFVTGRPADFGWLEQSWMRAASVGAQLPLRRLFDLAYAGIGERGPHPVPLDAEEAWTTVERSFRLQRPVGVAEGGGS